MNNTPSSLRAPGPSLRPPCPSLRAQRGNQEPWIATAYGLAMTSRIRHCVRVAEVFPDAEIVNTLCSQLSWSHLRLILQIEAPLKRDFYLEICRLERWSVRQLQERINSLLFADAAQPPYTGVVVLGGSLERLKASVTLLRQHLHLRLLFTGGDGKWWASGPTEADEAEAFFKRMGVPADRVLYERWPFFRRWGGM